MRNLNIIKTREEELANAKKLVEKLYKNKSRRNKRLLKLERKIHLKHDAIDILVKDDTTTKFHKRLDDPDFEALAQKVYGEEPEVSGEELSDSGTNNNTQTKLDTAPLDEIRYLSLFLDHRMNDEAVAEGLENVLTHVYEYEKGYLPKLPGMPFRTRQRKAKALALQEHRVDAAQRLRRREYMYAKRIKTLENKEQYKDTDLTFLRQFQEGRLKSAERKYLLEKIKLWKIEDKAQLFLPIQVSVEVNGKKMDRDPEGPLLSISTEDNIAEAIKRLEGIQENILDQYARGEIGNKIKISFSLNNGKEILSETHTDGPEFDPIAVQAQRMKNAREVMMKEDRRYKEIQGKIRGLEKNGQVFNEGLLALSSTIEKRLAARHNNKEVLVSLKNLQEERKKLAERTYLSESITFRKIEDGEQFSGSLKVSVIVNGQPVTVDEKIMEQQLLLEGKNNARIIQDIEAVQQNILDQYASGGKDKIKISFTLGNGKELFVKDLVNNQKFVEEKTPDTPDQRRHQSIDDAPPLPPRSGEHAQNSGTATENNTITSGGREADIYRELESDLMMIGDSTKSSGSIIASMPPPPPPKKVEKPVPPLAVSENFLSEDYMGLTILLADQLFGKQRNFVDMLFATKEVYRRVFNTFKAMDALSESDRGTFLKSQTIIKKLEEKTSISYDAVISGGFVDDEKKFIYSILKGAAEGVQIEDLSVSYSIPDQLVKDVVSGKTHLTTILRDPKYSHLDLTPLQELVHDVYPAQTFRPTLPPLTTDTEDGQPGPESSSIVKGKKKHLSPGALTMPTVMEVPITTDNSAPETVVLSNNPLNVPSKKGSENEGEKPDTTPFQQRRQKPTPPTPPTNPSIFFEQYLSKKYMDKTVDLLNKFDQQKEDLVDMLLALKEISGRTFDTFMAFDSLSDDKKKRYRPSLEKFEEKIGTTYTELEAEGFAFTVAGQNEFIRFALRRYIEEQSLSSDMSLNLTLNYRKKKRKAADLGQIPVPGQLVKDVVLDGKKLEEIKKDLQYQGVDFRPLEQLLTEYRPTPTVRIKKVPKQSRNKWLRRTMKQSKPSKSKEVSIIPTTTAPEGPTGQEAKSPKQQLFQKGENPFFPKGETTPSEDVLSSSYIAETFLLIDQSSATQEYNLVAKLNALKEYKGRIYDIFRALDDAGPDRDRRLDPLKLKQLEAAAGISYDEWKKKGWKRWQFVRNAVHQYIMDKGYFEHRAIRSSARHNQNQEIHHNDGSITTTLKAFSPPVPDRESVAISPLNKKLKERAIKSLAKIKNDLQEELNNPDMQDEIINNEHLTDKLLNDPATLEFLENSPITFENILVRAGKRIFEQLHFSPSILKNLQANYPNLHNVINTKLQEKAKEAKEAKEAKKPKKAKKKENADFRIPVPESIPDQLVINIISGDMDLTTVLEAPEYKNLDLSPLRRLFDYEDPSGVPGFNNKVSNSRLAPKYNTWRPTLTGIGTTLRNRLKNFRSPFKNFRNPFGGTHISIEDPDPDSVVINPNVPSEKVSDNKIQQDIRQLAMPPERNLQPGSQKPQHVLPDPNARKAIRMKSPARRPSM